MKISEANLTCTRIQNVTRRVFRNLLKRLTLEKVVIGLSVVIFTIVMSYFSIMRMYALKSNAWDLGIYNQSMYTFVFDGKLFFLTPEVLNNPGGSLFGIHFSPIFFLQTPFYFLYPRPETLLVLQAFVVGSGAIPTFLISREYLKTRKWQLLSTFAYLLNPAVIGIIAFDFHPEAYIPVFYLFTLYFYIRNNWKGMWIFSILLMLTIEFAPILLIIFAIFFISRDSILPSLRQNHSLSNQKLPLVHLTALIIVSILWLLVAFKIISIFNPFVPLTQGRTEIWTTLGASNLLQVPTVAILNPDKAFAAMAFDGMSKAQFLTMSSIPWLTLSLFSCAFWFLASPMLFPALLSNTVNFYTIGTQHASFIVAPMTYGGILVVSKILRSARLGKISVKIKFKGKATFLCFMILGLLLSNPFLSLDVATNPFVGYGNPVLSDKALAVRDLLTLIPSDGAVLTDSNIFPMLSSRTNAFTLPFQIDFNNISFFRHIEEQIERVDYILIDPDYWQPWPAITAVILSRTQEFGVVGYQEGVLALKRGYEGDPIIFKQPAWSFNSLNLYLIGGMIVNDISSQSGRVLLHFSSVNSSDFWWGPYMYISAPGEYEVTFWMKTIEASSGRIMDLDCGVFPIVVSADTRSDNITGTYQTLDLTTSSSVPEQALSGITLFGQDLTPNVYTPIKMKIKATVSGFYEFRGKNVSAGIPVYLDKIDVVMINPYSYTEPVLIQFNDYNPFVFEKNHSDAATKLGQLVERNSKLLLQKELFPLVVHPNFTVPIDLESINTNVSMVNLQNLVEAADFIMLDWKSNMTISAIVMSSLSNSSDFGVYAFSDDILLLKRHYQDDPIVLAPTSLICNYDDFAAKKGTYLVHDVQSANAFVLLHNSSSSEFWWGPYVYLFPGEYRVTYRLKTSRVSDNRLFTLRISHFKSDIVWNSINSASTFEINFTGIKTELGSRIVTGADFGSPDSYNIVEMNLIANRFGPYEFPGRDVEGESSIYLDEIRFELLSPYSQIDFS